MRVFAYDPYVNAESAKKIGAELVDLEKLPKESDLVTLHLILTKNTRGMISTKELDLMKPTVYLINASRGPIVDEAALIKAWRERESKIDGAGLDVC